MLDQFIGLVLLGLGLKTPAINPNVRGDSTQSSVLQVQRDLNKEVFKQELKRIQEEAKKKRETLKDTRKSLKTTSVGAIRLDIKSIRKATGEAEKNEAEDELEHDIEDRKLETQELKDRLDILKREYEEKRKEAIADFAEKQKIFKEQLKLVKDEKKQATAESINTRAAAIHDKGIEELKKSIERLTSTLEKAVAIANDRGITSDALTTAISQAKDAISAAQQVLNDEAGKQYVATITSETTLGASIKGIIADTRAGLGAVQKKIIVAKQEVMDVVQLVRTSSATPTPTP